MELALDKVPLRIELLFLAAVLGVLALFVLAVHAAAQRTKQHEVGLWTVRVASGAAIWLASTGLLANTGVLLDFSFPPKMFFLLLVSVTLACSVAFSQAAAAESWWLIITIVRPCCALIDARISEAVLLSTLARASSNTSTGAETSSALASAVRCLCPPLSVMPRSPTRVSKPSGKPRTSSMRRACCAAAATRSIEAWGSPKRRLSARLLVNR